jgi:N4-gp56 family major capsid protein
MQHGEAVMAQTSYGVNALEARKAWEKILAVETLDKTYVGKFIGKSADSLIQEKGDLNKDKGDKVTFILRTQLTGRGVQGDAQLKGNEEKLTTYTDAVVLDQRRHAASAGGAMSRQRVPFETREECMDALSDWAADLMDASFFNQIAGVTSEADTLYTGNNAVAAPSAGRIIRPGANTTDQAVQADTTAVFDLKLIDRAVAACTPATKGTPRVRPIMIGGKPHYAMFLHPWQVYQMRTNASDGQWLDIQKAAMKGGEVTDSPIFTGALGMYNNVVLHDSNRIPNGCHSTSNLAQASTRRAVLCGAQAAALAFGKGYSFEKFKWVEDFDDYENQLGVGGGAIFGLKKTVFNGADFGTVVVSTYSPDPNA